MQNLAGAPDRPGETSSNAVVRSCGEDGDCTTHIHLERRRGTVQTHHQGHSCNENKHHRAAFQARPPLAQTLSQSNILSSHDREINAPPLLIRWSDHVPTRAARIIQSRYRDRRSVASSCSKNKA